MLPNVDNKNLAGRKREQGTLALEVLILASFSTVCAFDVHDKNVFRHAGAAFLTLVLAHPYSLGSLAALLLCHDTEMCTEEIVEQGGFSGRLRTEDGYQVVVEASRYDFLEAQVCGDILAALRLR
jgi:hypothetical protein